MQNPLMPLELPAWLPEAVKKRGCQILPHLSQSVLEAKNSLESAMEKYGEKAPEVMFWKDYYQNQVYQFEAIKSLYHERKPMEAIWKEIVAVDSNKVGYLETSIINAFTFWRMKDGLPSGSVKASARKAISALRKLSETLCESSELGFFFDQIAVVMINDEIKEKLNECGVNKSLPGHKSAFNKIKSVSENFDVFNAYILDQPKIFLAIADELSRALEGGFFDHNPKGHYPRKINSASAEKVYFIRVISNAVHDIFSQSRPSVVVKILPLIRAEWEDVDESLVCKNLAKLPN